MLVDSSTCNDTPTPVYFTSYLSLFSLHAPAVPPAQAAAAYEAGLATDPSNPALKAGLLSAQRGCITDMLSGKALAPRALPAPPTPQQITLAPHNSSSRSSSLLLAGLGSSGTAVQQQQRALLGPGQLHAVGWRGPADKLLAAAAGGGGVGGGSGDSSISSALLLPAQLLTPAAVQADAALRDVFEYVKTQVGCT